MDLSTSSSSGVSRLNHLLAGLLFLLGALTIARSATSKEDVLAEIDALESKTLLKIHLDCDSTALAFDCAHSLDSNWVEGAQVWLTSAKLTETALSIVGLRDKVTKARSDPNIFRMIGRTVLDLVDLPENVRSLANQSRLLGAQIYAWEKSVETRASADQSVMELISEMKRTTKGNEKNLVYDYIVHGPKASPNMLRVRNFSSTVDRKPGIPLASIQAVRLRVIEQLNAARALVRDSNLSESQLAALREFLRARRTDLVIGMGSQHIARYTAKLNEGDGYRDVETAVELGRIGLASVQFTDLIEQFRAGINDLRETAKIEFVHDAADLGVDLIAETAQQQIIEKRWRIKLNSGRWIPLEDLTNIRRNVELSIDAADWGLDKVLDEVVLPEVTPPEMEFELIIDHASVKARLLEQPGQMFWLLPQEMAGTLLVINDCLAYVAATMPANSPPAPIPSTASLLIQETVPGTGIRIQQTGTPEQSVTLPFLLSGETGKKAVLIAPPDSDTHRFSQWVVDGQGTSSRELEVMFGSAKVATLSRLAIQTDPGSENLPSGSLWELTGEEQLRAGQTAEYKVRAVAANGQMMTATVAIWDTTNTALARIDQNGLVTVQTSLREPATIKILAWLPGAALTDRLEKSVTLVPTSGGKYFKVDVTSSLAGFTFDPEPELVNGELLFLEGSWVALTANIPSGYALKDWGESSLTENPLRFEVMQDRRIIPNIVPAGALTGPKRLTIDKPPGLGRILITAPRFSYLMKKEEARFSSDDLSTNDSVKIVLETDPTEEFIGWINASQEQSLNRTMVDHISLVARVRNRVDPPGTTSRLRSASLVLYPELMNEAWHSSSDSYNINIIDNGITASVAYSHGRPGRPDSFTDAYFKIQDYQLNRFPSQIKSARLTVLPQNFRGATQLMRPDKNITLPNSSQYIWSTLPGAIDYGASVTTQSGYGRVEHDFTVPFQNWRARTWDNWGLILRSRLSGYWSTFYTSNYPEANARPVLALDWEEEAPAPSAPIVVERTSATQVFLPGETARFSVTTVSNSDVSYAWKKDGEALVDQHGSSFEELVFETATYEVEITNAVGTTTASFAVSLYDVEAPRTLTAQTTWITDATGRVIVSGETTDDRALDRVQFESLTATVVGSTGREHWSAEFIVPPGVHLAEAVAYDSSNNFSRAVVRVVNPTGDTAAPSAVLAAERLPGGLVRVEWSVQDTTGAAELIVRAGSMVVSELTEIRDEGVTTAEIAAGIASLEVAIRDYAGNQTTVQVPIREQALIRDIQTLHFSPPSPVALSPMPLPLEAETSSGLPVTFSLLEGPAEISENGLILFNHGRVTLRVSQSGNENYEPASMDRSIIVQANYDQWAQAVFSPDESAEPLAVAAGDSISNLLRFGLGLDPRKAESYRLPFPTVVDGYWTYTYTRPATVLAVTHLVEVSTNLMEWTTEGVIHERISASATEETWQARFPVENTPMLFFRIVVDKP